MRILVVEDEAIIAENIKKILESQNYVTDTSGTVSDAEGLIGINSYDLIILDLMLPDDSGINLCKKLRSEGFDSPVIMLTAKSTVEDKAEGFDSGADDYLTKPFLSEELLMRVKALIRRKTGTSLSPILKFGQVTVDTNSRQVTLSGKSIKLSPREYSLFEYLVMNPGKALDRMEILDNVWGDSSDQFSNTVDVHIRYLRKKLRDEKGEIIKTVKGRGYMVCKD